MSNSGKPHAVDRDGQTWQLGTDKTVAWIERNTTHDLAGTSAIPPFFDDYATITELADRDSDEEISEPQQRLVEILRRHGETRWWLG